MKRVWVVDDKIPLHELYAGPHPPRLHADLVRHLVEQLPQEAWGEPAVLELCRALCVSDFEPSFFLTPEGMLQTLAEGALPPHAVVFDWEYPGSTNEKNLAAIERLLGRSFAYVQVYTHLGEGAVEPLLGELRAVHKGRLLPPRAKATVTPAALAQAIRDAWEGTIAGELADKVREEVFVAVERSLIDMCSVPRAEISAIAQGRPENLVHIVLSKVRDEITVGGGEALTEIVRAASEDGSSNGLRRLMSAWYYFFPPDRCVRRGDLIEIDGGLGLVVTPPCDLVKFPKKTGRRLTWVRCVLLDREGLATIRTAGYKLNAVGSSIVAAHGEAGDALVLLPNVPLEQGKRDALGDYVVLCHAWESRLISDAPGGIATYEHLDGLQRRCALADPFAAAVIARVTSVISSPGTPDLPKGELVRLNTAITPTPPGEGPRRSEQ
ncbi:MAG: hypothetical protein EYC70_13280 [Planctomycetota bacterium]|nr:MAG: hypothetical protein EYC70_13280 [Planctomycetota bacterium]